MMHVHALWHQFLADKERKQQHFFVFFFCMCVVFLSKGGLQLFLSVLKNKIKMIFFLTHLAPDQPLPFRHKIPCDREITVKWSRYTTLKINNKHQTKVSAHFIFFPVCEYCVLVDPTGFDFFHSKIKVLKKKESLVRNIHIWMSGCWVPMD